GAFYLQLTSEGQKPIGCQDALKLGEIVYKQYEEIRELRDPAYAVYKSLQQPGRFMLVPTAYRITRYGPLESIDKAYRPVVIIYAESNLVPENSKYYFSATLEADITYSARRDLELALQHYTPFGQSPVLDLPTAPSAQSTVKFQWAVPTGVDSPQV